jgi:hypothetical protein
MIHAQNKKADFINLLIGETMSPQAAALIVFLMEMLSASISILIGYYASKAYRTSSAKGLLFLYLGFIILGLGIFLRTITATYFVLVIRATDAVPNSLAGLSNVAGLVFTITQLAAYALFIATYAYQSKGLGQQNIGLEGVAAAAIFPVARLFYIPTLEIIAIVMLGFVALSSMINWLHRRTINSALVFLGFGFMFFSHVLYLFMIFNEGFLFFGQLSQLGGFVCLLLMLAKVNRANA